MKTLFFYYFQCFVIYWMVFENVLFITHYIRGMFENKIFRKECLNCKNCSHFSTTLSRIRNHSDSWNNCNFYSLFITAIIFPFLIFAFYSINYQLIEFVVFRFFEKTASQLLCKNRWELGFDLMKSNEKINKANSLRLSIWLHNSLAQFDCSYLISNQKTLISIKSTKVGENLLKSDSNRQFNEKQLFI